MSTASPPRAAAVFPKAIAGHLQIIEGRVRQTSYPERFRADTVWRFTAREVSDEGHALEMLSSELDFGRLLQFVSHPEQASQVSQSRYLHTMAAELIRGLASEVKADRVPSAPSEASWFEVDLGDGSSCTIGFTERREPKQR